ncbi:MAG: hypothetical protein DRJ42_10155, partial [Deltaproteobacteria bacterium]
MFRGIPITTFMTMTPIRLTSFALSLLLLPGCYLGHGNESDAGAPAPTPRDSAADSDIGRDASSDGAPLPADPDPDLGPDARPSDYPEADDWRMPPRIGAEDPCCVMEEPVVIADEDESFERGIHWRGGLAVEWGAGRWAVATQGFERETLSSSTTLFELAPDGRRYGTHELGLSVVSEAFRYAEGRWGFVGFVDDLIFRHALRMRTDFSFVSDPMALGPNHERFEAVARLTHGNTWVAFRHLDG